MSMGDPENVCHTKKLKIKLTTAKRGLRQQYIRILQLLLQFHTKNGFGLSADSDEFYEFVKQNGLSNISQEKLKSAVHFMEESFEKSIRERGKNARFMDSYLAERFQLAKQIWGPPDKEDNDDQIADEEYIRILLLLIQFHTEYGFEHSADSAEFYKFVKKRGLVNISQEKLKSAVLFMKESFEETIRERGMNAHFINSNLEERFQLAKQIWGPLEEDEDEDHDDKIAEEEYIKILRYLLQFHTKYGFGLSADSAEFYAFVEENGLANFSQEKLKSAVLNLKEHFEKTIRERGENAQFMNSYLKEAFELAKEIWGPFDEDEDGDDQKADEENLDDQKADEECLDDQTANEEHLYDQKADKENLDDQKADEECLDDQKANEEHLDDQLMHENVNDDKYDDAVEDEEQDFMDIAILKSIICFYLNSKVWPEPDSDELYNFFVRESIKNIPQDLLVDKILLLEEHFNTIDTQIMMDETVNFRNPRRKEIFRLSRKIWGDPYQFSSDYEYDDSDEDNNAENQADEQEDQGYNEQRDILDITILRAVLSFMRFNRYTPKADNKQLYNLVVEFKILVTREKMVARLLFLEGNFKRTRESKVSDFQDLRLREIYVLSKIIWGGEPQGS